MKKDFEIDTSLYAPDSILGGIQDFGEVAHVSYQEGILSIEGESMEQIEEIFREFMNYILSL